MIWLLYLIIIPACVQCATVSFQSQFSMHIYKMHDEGYFKAGPEESWTLLYNQQNKTKLKIKSFSDRRRELPGICLNVKTLNTFLPQRIGISTRIVISTSLSLNLVLLTLGKKGRRAKLQKRSYICFNQQRNLFMLMKHAMMLSWQYLQSAGVSGFKAQEALK